MLLSYQWTNLSAILSFSLFNFWSKIVSADREISDSSVESLREVCASHVVLRETEGLSHVRFSLSRNLQTSDMMSSWHIPGQCFLFFEFLKKGGPGVPASPARSRLFSTLMMNSFVFHFHTPAALPASKAWSMMRVSPLVFAPKLPVSAVFRNISNRLSYCGGKSPRYVKLKST